LAYVRENGLAEGTHPENVAAMWLHRYGHRFAQQHAAAGYRIDIAWPAERIGLEIDGPHHGQPEQAVRDVIRDSKLRSLGWLVLRVDTGETFEDQLAVVSRALHLLRGTSGGSR
jgi:very-short-patch-repair endonuclease